MKKIRVCTRCVMDNIRTNIIFDENGYCNFCTEAIERKPKEWIPKGTDKLDNIIYKLKKKNKNKDYDCVIGISGGIDSAYCAYFLKKKYNLRMLGIHVNAGWNTEIAEKNIKILCENLDIDLKVVKIDNKEMYELQRSYFLSEVINQDVPQDNVFFNQLYKHALKYNIKDFIGGGNFSSESILPREWAFNAMDGRNLKDIHTKYGRIKLKETKPYNFWSLYLIQPYLLRLKKIRPLNCINYNKIEALEILQKEIGFMYYGGKHTESSFTRLYQGYLLPQKFGVVKLKAHLSSLIVAGQMTRKQALKQLSKNTYIGSKQMKQDIDEFINKIDITKEEFKKIVNNNFERSHREFKNYEKRYLLFSKILNMVKRSVNKWKRR